MTRIAVSGATGRMGRELSRLAAERDDVEIIGGIARDGRSGTEAASIGYPCVDSVSDAGSLIRSVDVVIDFSAPEQLARLIEAHGDGLAGHALVVGTTGLEPWLAAKLDEIATRVAVLVASNFSIGINVLLALLERAGALLGAGAYDVEIVETHHRHKTDAPSGTAIAMGDAVARGRGDTPLSALRRDGRSGRLDPRPEGEIVFHSLRGGEVPGDHRVYFMGVREQIELAHRALERAVFADGALTAARWVAGREPGRYQLRDMLGL